MAFGAARERRRKLTSVDKANVLASSRLWRRVVNEVALDYADVEVEHVLVDACAMYLIQKPSRFDVILAENLFGDILSDEASIFAGSLGMLPSASLGPLAERPSEQPGRFGLYEAVHGSAPDIAGRGIANPVGTLLSCAMLLRHSLGLETEAAALEAAIEQTLASGLRTADLRNDADSRVSSTSELTDAVRESLRKGARSFAEEDRVLASVSTISAMRRGNPRTSVRSGIEEWEQDKPGGRNHHA